ncbi:MULTISPECIES: DUF6142 family protein [Oscillospiraceae]|uniref:DUF6142 family protein n=1 Tax=Oscillospiraceae TaxID=216572 RepID=UPI001FAA9ED6|nr:MULTISPECIES: DUF6142 family protein [Oscillospiraceae]
MWKNDKENDRGRRRIRGRKRRERERERRKKRIQKRDENRTPHASRGITSCIYAGGFFVVLIVMIIISIVTGGNAPAFVGGLALVIFFGSWMGVITGFRGFKERDKNYITCKIGVACNLAILIGFAGIFIRGLL